MRDGVGELAVSILVPVLNLRLTTVPGGRCSLTLTLTLLCRLCSVGAPARYEVPLPGSAQCSCTRVPVYRTGRACRRWKLPPASPHRRGEGKSRPLAERQGMALSHWWRLLLMLLQQELLLPTSSAPAAAVTPLVQTVNRARVDSSMGPNLRGRHVRPVAQPRARGPPDAALAAAIQDVMSYARLHMHDITSPSVDVTTNLSATLNNTYTFTAAQTWHRFHAGDGTVFIDTGDIHQQWLRDSSNQMRVYIPLAKASKPVADVFVNALKRMSQYFVGDTYASAFNPLPRDQMGDSSLYSQCPKSLECLNCTCEDCAPTCSQYSYQHNFELDSFCFTVDLAHRYWNATNDARAFDQTFHSALGKFVDLLVTEQDHGNLSPYRFRTNWTDQSAPNNHVAPPKPTAKVGLLWSDSRPSDDREGLNYNIPQNMFATVALAKAAELASKIFNDPALAARATNLSASVNEAIELFGVFKGNLTVPRMYAFEVDGFGNQVLMDDANMPNLLGIPYMVPLCQPRRVHVEQSIFASSY